MTQTTGVYKGAEPESESEPGVDKKMGTSATATAKTGFDKKSCCTGGVFGRVDKFLKDQVTF